MREADPNSSDVGAELMLRAPEAELLNILVGWKT
jgi:hypothetical protein